MVAVTQLHGLNQRLVVQTSDGQSSYLVTGRRGNYIKVSPSAYYLLRQVQAGRSFDEIAVQLSTQRSTPVVAAEVEVAYQRVIDQIATIESKAHQAPAGFWVRTSLIPASGVRAISRCSAWFFHPVAAMLLIGMIIAGIALSVRAFGFATVFTLDEEQMTPFLAIYSLFLLSLVFHELGHASACTWFRVPPDEIGFAFYWIYPAFYTNVNAAWQLRPWQRVVVDLAGVFFQLIVGTIYLLLAWLYTWDVGLKAFVMVFYSCLFMLNPFWKFDGYWLVADSLGITNFGRELGKILRTSYQRLRGQSAEPLRWPRLVLGLMGVYVLAGIGFWGYFFGWVAPEILSITVTYPGNLVRTGQEILNGTITIERLESLFLPTFAVVGVILISSRILRWVGRSIQVMWQSRPPVQA